VLKPLLFVHYEKHRMEGYYILHGSMIFAASNAKDMQSIGLLSHHLQNRLGIKN
jgi:hypothetical protein